MNNTNNAGGNSSNNTNNMGGNLNNVTYSSSISSELPQTLTLRRNNSDHSMPDVEDSQPLQVEPIIISEERNL